MRGQFFIIAAFLLIVSLSIILRNIKYFPRFDFKDRELFFISGFRYLPNKLAYNFIKLELYNFERDYEGPIIIPLNIYYEFNSKNSFTVIFDKPYFILFSYVPAGESTFLEFNKEKRLRYFYKGDCIGTRNYSICNNYIYLPPGKIYFNFSLEDWGDVFVSFDSGVFLPNSVIFFYEKNITIENLNYTDVGDGYKFYNGTLEVYLIGNVSYLGSNTFNVKKGVLFFGDLVSSRMAYYQNFYLYKLEQNMEEIAELNIIPACYENEIECKFSKEEREISGYYNFLCNETGLYNFVTEFSDNIIGSGRKCYSIRGIEGVSKFEPKRTGEYKKEINRIRVFDKERFMTDCTEDPFEWYSNKYFRGLDAYIDLGDISGNFSIYMNSTGDFWINFSSGVIYQIYPSFEEIRSSRRFFYYQATFYVNSTVNNMLIPIYSKINGTVSNLRSFYSKGDTMIKCSYCNVKIFQGPIKIYDEIISEKTYYLRGNYVVCDPSCNVTSSEIYFYSGNLYCPPYPGLYLRARYLLNDSFEELYKITENPFKIQDIKVCIDDYCSAEVYSGSTIFFGKISNCSFEIEGDSGYFYCSGKHKINFSEVPEFFNNKLVLSDKFYLLGDFQKIDDFNYNFTDYFEIYFYNSGDFYVLISRNETEIRRGGIVIK